MENLQKNPSRDSHLLFLSHAGIDTEAACALAKRIESTPEAQERGLKVWLDKKDLKPGQSWQTQLELALDLDSTAFAVYVGSKGVINWVDSEVRVALSRAGREPDYPFIPILSQKCSVSEELPAFARQYQGVIDVESNPEEFAKLIRAATRQEHPTPVQLVDEPFIGLRAFEEKDTHLFFGRDEDADELVQRLKRSRLIMAVGDSGSGKSSLVKAGLIPRYRGGALNKQHDSHVDTTIWHVVETRPRSTPFDSLADSVAVAAKAIGRSQNDIRTLRKMVRDKKPCEVADALRDGAPEHARILVIVDQFEELFTLSNKIFRGAYIEMLLYLAKHDSPTEFRIVLTMRRDYYNLCHEYSELYTWLEGVEPRAKFSVRRMSDAQLRNCIEKPLALTDIGNTEVFVTRVLADVGDQPGELALLEMALTESWRRRRQCSGDILQIYITLGGTAGTLANVADEVFNKLDEIEQVLAQASLIRLVRLGETGGTTRRIAARDEFSKDAWCVLQKLATEDYGRLIYISGTSPTEQTGGDLEIYESGEISDAKSQSQTGQYDQQCPETAELSHEALVSQWPIYQSWLQASPNLKRVHDRIIQSTKIWLDRGMAKGDLATGSTLDEGLALLDKQANWLSPSEREFLDAGRATLQKSVLLKRMAVGLLVVLTIIASVITWYAQQKQDEALHNGKIALSRQLAAQSEGLKSGNPTDLPLAGLLAVEAIRRFPSSETSTALSGVLDLLPRPLVKLPHEGRISHMAVSVNKNLIATAGEDRKLILWDFEGKKVGTSITVEGGVTFLSLSDNGELIAVGVNGEALLVIRLDTSEIIARIGVSSTCLARFANGGKRIVVASGRNSNERSVSLWNLDSEAPLLEFPVHRLRDLEFRDLALSPHGKYAAVVSRNKEVIVFETETGNYLPPISLQGEVTSVDFGFVLAMNPKKEPVKILTLVTSSSYKNLDDGGVVELWQIPGGNLFHSFPHRFGVTTALLFPESSQWSDLLISSDETGTVRTWQYGIEIGQVQHTKVSFGLKNITPNPVRQQFATWSYFDDFVRVWNVLGTEIMRIACEGPLLARFNSAGDKLVTLDRSGAWIWEAAGESLWETHGGNVNDIAFSDNSKWILSGGSLFESDDRWLTGDGDLKGEIYLRHSRSGESELHISLDAPAEAVVFGQDKEWFAAAVGSRVLVYSIASGKLLKELKHNEDVRNVLFSPLHSILLSITKSGLTSSWDTKTWKREERYRESIAVALSQDQEYLVFQTKDGIYVESFGSERKVTLAETSKFSQGFFGLVGSLIVVQVSKRELHVWDLESGKQVSSLPHPDDINTVAVSSKWIVTSVSGKDDGPGLVFVWDVNESNNAREIPFSTAVTQISISPGSEIIATGHKDGRVRLWEPESGSVIFEAIHKNVGALTFSPDGKWLVTAESSWLQVGNHVAAVRMYIWKPEDLITEACSRLTRNLTKDEWRYFIGNTEWQQTCPDVSLLSTRP